MTERALIGAVFVAIIVVWHLVVVGWGFSPLVLPSPARVAQSLGTNLANGLLLTHLWVTLEEIGLGFLGGSALGIGLGTLIAHSRRLDRVLGPYIIASQAMPKLA